MAISLQGPSPHNVKLLLKLLDYSIETFYPDIWQSHTDPEARYIQFYQEVVRRTARLRISASGRSSSANTQSGFLFLIKQGWLPSGRLWASAMVSSTQTI